MDYLLMILVIGLIATLLMDFWQIIVRMAFKIPTTDWTMVGRWLAYLPKGGFSHKDIRKTKPTKGEGFAGMIFHYGLGILFTALYLYIFSVPTLINGIIFGLATLVVPWFVLQPGMGLGFFAANHPRPIIFLSHNLTSNFVYGAGLFWGYRVFLSMGI